MTPLQLRCSNLGRVQRCGQAAVAPRERRDTAGPDAALGNLCDVYLKSLIKPPALDPTDLADLHNVDPSQARKLCARILWRWERQAEPLRKFFPDAAIPERREMIDERGFVIGGTPDLESLVGYEYRVADLKSGFRAARKDHWSQLFGYGLLGVRNTDATSARLTVWNLWDDSLETKMLSAEELAGWWDGLVRFLQSEDAQHYNADPETCRYCPRFHECTAASDMIRTAAQYLTTINGCIELTPDQLASILERARMVEKACAMAKDVVKMHLDNAGGVLPLSDGRELYVEQQRRKKILWPMAQEIVAKHVPAAAVAECLTLGKTKLEDALKAQVGRGSKAAFVKSVIDELEAAGCVEESVSEWPDVRRAKPQIGAQAG